MALLLRFCLLLALPHMGACGGGGASGESTARIFPSREAGGNWELTSATAAAIPGSASFLNTVSRQTIRERSRVLAIETDRPSATTSLDHGTNVERAILGASAANAVQVQRCDAFSYAEINACLGRSTNSDVINYSRLLVNPADPDERAVTDLIPTDALFVVAAGNGATGGARDNTQWIRDYLDAALIVVAGATGADRAAGSVPCGPAQEHCLLAPYRVELENAGRPGVTALPAGTSFSAALVSGLAATVRARWPELNAARTARLFLNTCAMDAGTTGVDRTFGHGLLNVDCLFNPSGELELPGGSRLSAAGFQGILQAGTGFRMPALRVLDRTGRDFYLAVPQQRLHARRPLTSSLYRLLRRAARPQTDCHPICLERFHWTRSTSPQDALLWHRSMQRGNRLFIHLQLNDRQLLGGGSITRLGPAQWLLGAALNRRTFAGGEMTGSGELAFGTGTDLFSGFAVPLRYRAIGLTPWISAAWSKLLIPAGSSLIRDMQVRQWGLGLSLDYQPRSLPVQFLLHTSCHSGLRGSARISAAALSFEPLPSCEGGLELQWGGRKDIY